MTRNSGSTLTCFVNATLIVALSLYTTACTTVDQQVNIDSVKGQWVHVSSGAAWAAVLRLSSQEGQMLFYPEHDQPPNVLPFSVATVRDGSVICQWTDSTLKPKQFSIDISSGLPTIQDLKVYQDDSSLYIRRASFMPMSEFSKFADAIRRPLKKSQRK